MDILGKNSKNIRLLKLITLMKIELKTRYLLFYHLATLNNGSKVKETERRDTRRQRKWEKGAWTEKDKGGKNVHAVSKH